MGEEKLFNHDFIVFCEDHYNPLGAVRSLGEEGIAPYVILLANTEPRMVPYSKYVKGRVKMVETIEEGYQYLLAEFSNRDNKPFIISCSDNIESYLDMHYNELSQHFYFFDGGSQGQITRVMEKNEMSKLAIESGMLVPRTENVKVGELPKGLRYPVMTKTTLSLIANWKKNVHICYNEQELLEAYKGIELDRINVQEYIEKENELCIDGVSINGGDEIYMPIQSSYIRFSPTSYGNYVLFEQYKESELYDKIHSLFQKTCFSGVFCLEFIKGKDGNFYFLEINYRNSTWSYAHTYEGVNLLLIWARSVLKGKLDTTGVTIRKVPFIAMAEHNDFHDSVVTRRVSLWQWIKELKQCDCLFIYNKKDPKPFRRFLSSELWRLVKKFVFRIK